MWHKHDTKCDWWIRSKIITLQRQWRTVTTGDSVGKIIHRPKYPTENSVQWTNKFPTRIQCKKTKPQNLVSLCLAGQKLRRTQGRQWLWLIIETNNRYILIARRPAGRWWVILPSEEAARGYEDWTIGGDGAAVENNESHVFPAFNDMVIIHRDSKCAKTKTCILRNA